MKRVACYLRVSTAEQRDRGMSIDSQKSALEQYCKDNNYNIVGFYNDAGISASKSYKHRTALLSLIDDCKAGKIDLILFTKLDRWFRSVADYYEVQSQLDACHVAWRAIWEDYETETSSGIFKVNIMLSIATAESQRTSERIKAVNEYRRAKGDFVGGLAPLGYKVAKNQLVIDADTQPAVKAFFDTYLATLSPIEAIKSAETLGVHISRPQAIRMIKNTVYSGEAYGYYKCEAYISAEEQERLINAVEGRRTRDSGKDKVYLFSKILRCGYCGGAMTSRYHGHKRGDKVYRYKCYQCSRYALHRGCDFKKTVFESTLEKYLLSELDNIISDYTVKCELSPKEKADNETAIKKLEDKLVRIGQRFEDGDIDRDEYRAKRDSIKAEISNIKSSSVSTQAVQLPDNWREVYNELDDVHKRAFWSRIIKKIDVKASNSFTVEL